MNVPTTPPPTRPIISRDRQALDNAIEWVRTAAGKLEDNETNWAYMRFVRGLLAERSRTLKLDEEDAPIIRQAQQWTETVLSNFHYRTGTEHPDGSLGTIRITPGELREALLASFWEGHHTLSPPDFDHQPTPKEPQ